MSSAPQQPFILYTELPGPDRKRLQSPYGYRLIHRNPNSDETGCIMTWEVTGGRMVYQIALERDEQGTLRMHCTCADAVFRAEEEGRFCKHVRGLLQAGKGEEPDSPPVSLGA
jgi:hypothetical protein